MATLKGTLTGPNLPSPFVGVPNDFLEFLRANYVVTLTLSPEDLQALQVNTTGVIGVPIGAVIMWPSASADPPSDKFLFCDGKSKLIADYPDLYEALGEPTGEDEDHFPVPDVRGRTVLFENTDNGSGLADAYPGDTVARPGKLPPYAVGAVNAPTYVGNQFPTNETPQTDAPDYNHTKASRFLGPVEPNNTGITARTTNNIGSVVQPAIVWRAIIRAK